MISMIFATGPNGEFGKGESLPWNCPEDLHDFKQYTDGTITVMSEATFRSLPFALPNRTCVVLSDSECYAKNGDEPDIIFPTKVDLRGLCEFLDDVSPDDICIIGGRKLIAEASTFAHAASMTIIDKSLVEEGADAIIDYKTIISTLSSRRGAPYEVGYKHGRNFEWM